MRCCSSTPRRCRRTSPCSARSAAATRARSNLPQFTRPRRAHHERNRRTCKRRPNGKRRRILILIAVIFIVLGVLWAAYWVLVLSKRERTDDAYVNGNKVVISAQVSGTVIAVLADDTQLVKAGQVLGAARSHRLRRRL